MSGCKPGVLVHSHPFPPLSLRKTRSSLKSCNHQNTTLKLFMQTAKQLNVRRKSKWLPHKVVVDRTQWLCPCCFRMKELEMTYFYTEEKGHYFRDLETLQRWSVKKRFTTVPWPLSPWPQACVTLSSPAGSSHTADDEERLLLHFIFTVTIVLNCILFNSISSLGGMLYKKTLHRSNKNKIISNI